MYLDDILIVAPTEEAHLRILDKVLGHLEQAGLRAKQVNVHLCNNQLLL